MTFEEVVRKATGHEPYPYQARLADHGLPELLKVPTGTGKTLAAALAWLYRRRFHPDAAVRVETPHWLVYTLPMRVLVEQTHAVVGNWLKKLGLSREVGLHLVMGGEERRDGTWRLRPERDAIFIGTLDMLLSRALNRGYAENRFAWPIDFGLFNAGCQWVFDEVQLMGPALPTSRQLEGLRESLGTAIPCSSMWMSATAEERWMGTFDRPLVASVVELADGDRTGPLAGRLQATKVVRRLDLPTDQKDYVRELAARIAGDHRKGTLTIAVLNTVDRAREVYSELTKRGLPDLVLLHSRFRPGDRDEHVTRALEAVDPAGPGRIVVSTQVLEAGVDISATTLFTEAAPWPSLVQRAGRCNRDGEADQATLLWASPPSAAPYPEEDVEATAAALNELEERPLRSDDLGSRGIPTSEEVHQVLRRRDLIGLFDTAPDLSGNDLDVSRFIRDTDDLDLQVAWREVTASGPQDEDPRPTRRELCPVPIRDLRAALKQARGGKERHAWRFDHLDERWVRVTSTDLRPGLVLVLRAEEGGYEQATGWNPRSTQPVTPVPPGAASAMAEVEQGTGADPMTFEAGKWQTLLEHLQDVEREARRLAAALRGPGLSEAFMEAAILAGRLHDTGKVHPVFQQTLLRSAPDEDRASVERGGPWAKSAKRSRHERRHFRHELASALALLGDGAVALEGTPEPDLVLYLVGAHHGLVRLAIRSLPGESPPSEPGRRVALGIWDGEILPAVEIPGGSLPECTLDLSVMEMGTGRDGRPSWTRRMLALRDREDLGPFRLAFLEAIVRLADWRASAGLGERGES